MYANLERNGFSAVQSTILYGDGVCSLCSMSMMVTGSGKAEENCFRLVCCGNRICMDCAGGNCSVGVVSTSRDSKPCDSCPLCKRILPSSVDKMRTVIDEHISKLTPWAFYVYGQWWEKLNLDMSYPGGLKPEGTVVGSKNTRASHALKLYEKGRSLGDVGCMYHLGVSYARDDSWLLKQDAKRSLLYLCEAAKLGHIGAQFKAARCYEKGSGAPICLPTAFKLFKQAADGGNPKAMGIISNIFQCMSKSAAHGVEWNPELSSYYRDTGCKLGDARSLLDNWSFFSSDKPQTGTLLYMRAAYHKLLDEEQAADWLTDPITDIKVFKEELVEAETLVHGHCAKCRIQASGSVKPRVKLGACPLCFTVYYCGRACQISHWKLVHKQECQFDYPMDPASATISRVRFVDKK